MNTETKTHIFGLHPKDWTRFLILTLPLVLLVVLVIASSKKVAMDAHLHNASLEGGQHIEYQASLIHEEIKRISLKLRFLSTHSHVLDVLENRDQKAKDLLSYDLSSFIMHMQTYDQVRLLDKHGKEIMRVKSHHGEVSLVPKHQLQDKSNHAYFKQAIKMHTGEIFVSRLNLKIENGEIQYPFKPMLRFSAPVLNREGSPIGVFVFNYTASTFINHFKDSGHSFGEKMIVDENGHYLLSPDSQKLWGSLLPERAHFSLKSEYPELWQQMIHNKNGQFFTADELFNFAMINPYAVISQTPAPEGMQHFFIINKIAAETLSQQTDNNDNHYTIMITILLLYWAYIAILWLRSETKRERAFNDLQKTLIEKRALLQKQMLIQENERRFLARTLHDEMGQALTAIQAYTAFIMKSTSKGDIEAIRNGADEIITVTSHMQHTIRSQLNDLRPAHLDRLGLGTALTAMIKAFCKREAIDYTLEFDSSLPLLSEEVNINLYRIVQEALTNIARYAKATHITIRLKRNGDELKLNIADNGIGMSENSVRGMGLLGIQERSELLKGNFTLQSFPNVGVKIKINIPIEVE